MGLFSRFFGRSDSSRHVDMRDAVVALAGDPFKPGSETDMWPRLFGTYPDENRRTARVEWLAFHAFLCDFAACQAALAGTHRDEILGRFAHAIFSNLDGTEELTADVMNARIEAYAGRFRGKSCDDNDAWRSACSEFQNCVKFAAKAGRCEVNQPLIIDNFFDDTRQMPDWHWMFQRAMRYHLIHVIVFRQGSYPTVTVQMLEDTCKRVEAAQTAARR